MVQTRTFLESAADFSRRGIAGNPWPELAQEAVELARTQLALDFTGFFELKPDGSATVQAGEGWNEGSVGRSSNVLGYHSPSGHVIRSQLPLAISDLHSAGGYVASPLLSEHGVVSALLVPVSGQRRPLGVLGAFGLHVRHFTSEEIAWLQIVANVLAGHLEAQGQHSREQDEHLLRAEQMMAIGQVAAGVAHELRNPLTSIKGLVQLNLRDWQDRGLPSEDLAIIEHEIRRMERTLQTFLDFARPPKPDRRSQDLNSIVDRVVALVGGRARKQQVQLRVDAPEAPLEIRVDQDQIQQLILNLVLNALDAMPQGGEIEISLQPPRSGFVSLYVRDNGPGIAPQILPKVFETFVSSKETGVGLGLPLSRRIAEEHGGTLTAYNLPHAGACFLLQLPASSPEDGQNLLD